MNAYSSMTSLRTSRFGHNGSNGAVQMRTRNPEGFTLDEVRRIAPATFATEAHASRSDRFVPIPSGQVLDAMWREGFRPFEVRQGGSRDIDRRGFTKHLIRFRHPQLRPVEALGGLYPEVILINANDGTAAYNLLAGVFRMVCSNGLIAGDTFDTLRVPHVGRVDQVASRVIEGSYRVIGEAPAVIDGARAMSALALSGPEQHAFSRAAHQLRWDDTNDAPIPADQLLRTRRTADAGADLWSTLNRVQENLTRGGQPYTLRRERGPLQHRRVGEVRSIDDSRRLNRALWTLADEMQRIRAAT